MAPEAAELSSAHAEGGGGEPSGGKAVRPNALPPLASKGGGKSSDSPKSKAGVPSLGGAPGMKTAATCLRDILCLPTGVLRDVRY
eukprot:3084295-Rhodomonas_salina.1